MKTKLDSKKVNELLIKYGVSKKWGYKEIRAFFKENNILNVEPELVILLIANGHKGPITVACSKDTSTGDDRYNEARKRFEESYTKILNEYSLIHLKEDIHFIGIITLHFYYVYKVISSIVRNSKGVKEEAHFLEFLEKNKKGITEIVFRTKTNQKFVLKSRNALEYLLGKVSEGYLDSSITRYVHKTKGRPPSLTRSILLNSCFLICYYLDLKKELMPDEGVKDPECRKKLIADLLNKIVPDDLVIDKEYVNAMMQDIRKKGLSEAV